MRRLRSDQDNNKLVFKSSSHRLIKIMKNSGPYLRFLAPGPFLCKAITDCHLSILKMRCYVQLRVKKLKILRARR